jgi:hypothetical protein
MIQTRLLHWMMIAALFVLLPGSLWAADPEPDKELLISVTTIDFDECEPVLIRSKIMDAHLKKGTLVVAEREVREMDVTSGGQRIKTSYLNIEGKPEPRAAFRAGQYVLVKGFQHPDGYIAASVVQKIEKPAEKKTIYKPVAESRRASRRNTAAAQPR